MPLDQLDDGQTEKNMTFLEHLEALRWHLFRSIIAIAIGTVVAMINYSFIFEKVIFAINDPEFPIYRAFCKLSQFLYNSDRICFEVIQINTQNLEVSGQFIYLMVVSFTVGIIIATPYILWQLWNFFEPALKPSERKYTTGIVFATSALFMTGVCFGYFVLSPLCINFFVHFSLSDQIINQFTLKSFVSFVTTLTLASGLIFELPLLIYTLSKLGLVTSTFLKKYRKHSVIVILIISSVITPPDVMSQILLTIPVYFLYEVGIIIAKRVETNAQIKLEEYES